MWLGGLDRLGGSHPYHLTSAKKASSSSLQRKGISKLKLLFDPTIVKINGKQYVDYIRNDQECSS